MFSGLLENIYKLATLPAYVEGFKDGLVVAGIFGLIIALLKR